MEKAKLSVLGEAAALKTELRTMAKSVKGYAGRLGKLTVLHEALAVLASKGTRELPSIQEGRRTLAEYVC
jgi:hypothetical protein